MIDIGVGFSTFYLFIGLYICIVNKLRKRRKKGRVLKKSVSEREKREGCKGGIHRRKMC